MDKNHINEGVFLSTDQATNEDCMLREALILNKLLLRKQKTQNQLKNARIDWKNAP